MLSLATLVLPALAAAQQPPERQREAMSGGTVGGGRGSAGTTQDIQFRVIKLEHNQAAMVGMLLQEILPTGVFKDNLRITSDVHSNSIVVAGIPEALQLVEDAIKELDVPESTPHDARSKPAEVRVFTLQQVSAREAAETLRSLYADQFQRGFSGRQRGGSGVGERLAIAADERANSVIVSGDKESLTTIEALLLRLDQPLPREEDRQTTVVGLQGVQADEALDTLRKLGLSRLEVVAEGAANQLILSGSRESVQQAAELLEKIYEGRRQNVDQVRLRVVWLVSPGLAGDEAVDPPKNLDRVLAALKSKAGVGELKMAAQFIVNASRTTSGSQELSASGTAKIQESKTQLSVAGRLESSDGPHPRLQISVDAMQPIRSNDASVVFAGNQQICQLRTTISAPPGHPVVLGMTPIDSMESVFVIELLPPDDAEGGRAADSGALRFESTRPAGASHSRRARDPGR